MLLSASEIIIRTWKTFTTHFVAIVKFMIVLGILYGILAGLKILSLATVFAGNVFLLLIGFVIVIIVTALISFWLNLALTKSLGEVLQNEKVEGVISALRSTASMYFVALGVSIVVALITFFGSLLLIIPGLIFAVWFLFAVYAVLFDKKNFLEALSFSKSLVVGRWWGIVWRAFIPQLLFIISILIIETVLILPFEFMKDGTVYQIITIIISAIGTAIFLPLSTLSILILYFNARENPVVRESNLLQK
jgi:hypothetical protein